MSVRVRFAPSPTGYLHVGGARTALFNWLYARRHGGTFVLRVEDTDEARNTEEARTAIFDGLRWLGLEWDEGPEAGGDCGPYFQSQRRSVYDAYLDRLTTAGRTYTEENGAVRFNFSRTAITVHDLVCGDVTFAPTEEPDMTIRRPDGSYIFHFVNVVDDLEMEITHVIRGEDHLMNTPKHLQLIEAFGGKAPQYAHIPLILNTDGSKMSKRDAGAAVGDYPRQGFLPDAVVNFLALVGWNSKTEEEIFTPAELIQRFSLEGVNRAPARFDIEKCAWVNLQHIAKMDAVAFAEAARPFVEKAGLPLPANFGAIAASVKEKVRLLQDVPAAVDFLIQDELVYDDEAVTKVRANAQAVPLLAMLAATFSVLSEWSGDAAKQTLAEVAKEAGAKTGQLMFPLRVALSGRPHGPDLGDILDLLGKDRCVARLNHFTHLLTS